MINENLQSLFSDFKNVNKATITVEVEMKPSKMVDSLATEVLNEMQRLVPYVGAHDVSDLEPEDISKYLKTLVWMRVKRVNGGFEDKFKAYRPLERVLAVPVLAYQALIAIGEAWDRDFSIKFIPTYSISETDLLAPDDMAAISDVLSRMERSGVKVVYGTPREEKGELDFMALCHVEGEVLGYRTSHPVYGFLASFFEQKKLNEITGTMCRIIYGYDSDYKLYLTQVFRALNPNV
jgi:hypothetical protein